MSLSLSIIPEGDNYFTFSSKGVELKYFVIWSDDNSPKPENWISVSEDEEDPTFYEETREVYFKEKINFHVYNGNDSKSYRGETVYRKNNKSDNEMKMPEKQHQIQQEQKEKDEQEKEERDHNNNIICANNELKDIQKILSDNIKVNYNSQDIKNFINQIDELKKQLSAEKENNNKLKTEIKKFEKIINALKQENIDFKNKLEKETCKLKESIKHLENELNSKNYAIQNYILEIKDLKENKNSITPIKPGEKIFSILFKTQENNDILNYSMACKNTELFVRLEERLYDDFPEYKKKETIFMVDNRRIFRFQTLDENKIKRNNIIYLFVVNSE